MKSCILFLLTILTVSDGRVFSFCQLFITGGTCESKCQFEAVHKWGIDFHLCPPSSTGNKCCIPLDHPLVRLFLKKQEKEKSTTTTTTTMASTTTTTQLLISTEPDDVKSERTCGKTHSKSRVRRVVGGKSAPLGAWPWQVAIRTYTGHYVCGGVLLNREWVLTAAHCFKEEDNNSRFLRIYLGDQTMSFDGEDTDNSVKIDKIIQHEHFERNVNVSTDDDNQNNTYTIRHVHDIALVKLQTSVEYSDDLEPICLPDHSENLDPMNCWVTGWGESGDTEGKPMENLQEVKGRSINYEECSKMWGANFTDNIICFGSEGRGPCKGDSGGGMVCRRDDGRFSLVGIVSWGREDCVHDDHPSVLTHVIAYKEWIDSQIYLSDDLP